MTPLEVDTAIREKYRLNMAPGPDGIMAMFWKLIPGVVLPKLADLFTGLLRKGYFPAKWKVARLVLIPKGEVPGTPPRARPICLLDEIGKILERIIAARMKAHLEQDPVTNLAPNQFGFRRGKSTIDAVLTVEELARDAIDNGKIGIGISLDIANAFNSIPWRVIRRQVGWRKKFPDYLCRIVDAYLSNRWIEFIDSNGDLIRRKVSAGVSQGSVFGPLLWNIAYDDVLRMYLYHGCTLICYADDTLIFVIVTASGTRLN